MNRSESTGSVTKNACENTSLNADNQCKRLSTQFCARCFRLNSRTFQHSEQVYWREAKCNKNVSHKELAHCSRKNTFGTCVSHE